MDLTPEERATVDGVMGGDHGGCEEKFGTVAEILQQFASELAELKRVVMDELIGGVSKLYEENTRFEKLEGLKGKYADLFKDSADAYGKLYKGDLWENLMGELDGVADEEVDGKVKSLAADLLERIKAVKGEPAAAVSVEVTKDAAPEKEDEEEEDPAAPIVQRIKAMKGKGGRVPGILGEPRD